MPIPRKHLFCLLALCLIAACNDEDGDEKDTSKDSAKSPETFADQVALGQTEFGEHCAECHGSAGQGSDKAPRLVGLDEGALPLDPPESRKVRKEQFVTVADVASFAVMNMPPGAAGSLSTKEYLAILAFDLKANGITLKQKLDLDLAETLTIPR